MLKIFTKEIVKPFPVPGYIVFNVDNFNNWFNNPNNNAVYANPGIFLRLDKLSASHVIDYIEKCYGISYTMDEFYYLYGEEDALIKFVSEIREDWKKRLIDKNKTENEL